MPKLPKNTQAVGLKIIFPTTINSNKFIIFENQNCLKVINWSGQKAIIQVEITTTNQPEEFLYNTGFDQKIAEYITQSQTNSISFANQIVNILEQKFEGSELIQNFLKELKKIKNLDVNNNLKRQSLINLLKSLKLEYGGLNLTFADDCLEALSGRIENILAQKKAICSDISKFYSICLWFLEIPNTTIGGFNANTKTIRVKNGHQKVLILDKQRLVEVEATKVLAAEQIVVGDRLQPDLFAYLQNLQHTQLNKKILKSETSIESVVEQKILQDFKYKTIREKWLNWLHQPETNTILKPNLQISKQELLALIADIYNSKYSGLEITTAQIQALTQFAGKIQIFKNRSDTIQPPKDWQLLEKANPGNYQIYDFLDKVANQNLEKYIFSQGFLYNNQELLTDLINQQNQNNLENTQICLELLSLIAEIDFE